MFSEKKTFSGRALQALVITAVLAFWGALLIGSADRVAAQEPIKIGTSFPTSGPIPYCGQHAIKASKIVIDDVNARGGIAGRKVQLVSYDNECSPEKATSVAERLIHRDKVHVIRGGLCSGCSLATLPIVQREKVPLVIAGSTSMKIKEVIGIGGNEWGFRVNLDDEHRGIALTHQLIEKMGLKRFVGLFPNDDWGRAGGEVYKRWIPKRGGTLLLDEYYDPEAQDFMAYLTKYKKMNIDGLILMGTPRQGAPVIKQAHNIGLNVQIATAGGALSMKTIELAGKEACAGIVCANSWTPASPNPQNKRFIERFKQRYGEDPIPDAAKAYFGMQVTLAAIENAIKEGGELKPATLREALEVMDVDTVVGRIRLNLHHQALHDIYISQIKDGKIILLKTIPAKDLTG